MIIYVITFITTSFVLTEVSKHMQHIYNLPYNAIIFISHIYPIPINKKRYLRSLHCNLSISVELFPITSFVFYTIIFSHGTVSITLIRRRGRGFP